MIEEKEFTTAWSRYWVEIESRKKEQTFTVRVYDRPRPQFFLRERTPLIERNFSNKRHSYLDATRLLVRELDRPYQLWEEWESADGYVPPVAETETKTATKEPDTPEVVQEIEEEPEELIKVNDWQSGQQYKISREEIG